MARNKVNRFKYSAKDKLYVERFAHDVFSSVLPLFGFSKARIPTTNRKENAYHLENLMMNAIALVAPFALIGRDKWMHYFNSRHSSTGFIDEDLPKYLTSILRIESRDASPRQKFAISLALHTEIVLFFDYKNLEIDFDTVVNSWSLLFMQFREKNSDVSETIENFFDNAIDNLPLHISWISCFIMVFGIPYGSRRNVSVDSEIYFKAVMDKKTKRDVDIEKVDVKELEDHLGFVPHEIASARLTEGDTVSFADGFGNLDSTMESVLPGNRVSPEPPMDTNTDQQTARSDQVGEQSHSAAEEVPEMSQGAIPKRKVLGKKKKKRQERKMEL